MNLVAKTKVQHIEFVLSEIQTQLRWAEDFTDLYDDHEGFAILDGFKEDLEIALDAIKTRHGIAWY